MNWKMADENFLLGHFFGKVCTDPAFVFGRLMRVYKLRKRMQNYAIRYCNGDLKSERYERLWDKAEKELRGELDYLCKEEILNYDLVLQDDPRGCVIEKLRFYRGTISSGNVVEWLCQ